MSTNEKILSWTEDNEEFLYYKGLYLFSSPQEENIDFESLINNQKFIDFCVEFISLEPRNRMVNII